jgi:UDP-3-O-[3-hydroxymyristoyl] glucosamine N-acyltransferase
VIFPNVTIGRGARIGSDCVIHSNVSVRERVIIGNRVILQNGVVIGGDGYGFVRLPDGTHEKIPQTAHVVIEDDVELGANTTVDRPAVGETRIKAGTKIDNLVQIAHGVTVGRNVLMAAQVGIAGSTDVGDDVVLGGQVGVPGHLTIGRGAIAVAKTGITNSVDPGVMLGGYPALEIREWRKTSVLVRRLPELKRRIEELEARLAAMTDGPDPSTGSGSPRAVSRGDKARPTGAE